MTICKFWASGYCKKGDRCTFEHPSGGATQANRTQSRNQNQNHNQFQQNQTAGQNQNRFGALQNAGNNSSLQGRIIQPSSGRGPQQYNNSSRDPRRSRDPKNRPYGLALDTIADDMKIERPQWIMSAYGPGKDCPVQLFEGLPLEQSFEEIRVQHYLSLASGTPQQSAQLEQELATLSNQRVQNVLNDLEGAMQYLEKGADTHPNRLDIIDEVAKNAKANERNYGNVFDRSNARPPPSAPSAFGNNPPPSGFGGHPFQQTAMAQNSGSAFGQPSSLGQGGGFGGNQGFGGNSASGASGNGFGNGRQPQAQNTFGQNTQFGQPTQMGQSVPFGQPAQQVNLAPFGQQPSNVNGNFGMQAQPTVQTSTFGQPMALAQNGTFGAPPQQALNQAFGQPSQMQNNLGALGAGTQNGQSFGQNSLQPSGFNTQPNQQLPTAFGQPQNNTSNTPNSSMAPPAMSGFQTQNQISNAFGQPQAPSTNGLQNQNSVPATDGYQSSTPAPASADVASYTTRDANNKLLTWKNQPVTYIDGEPCYRNQNGSWERIWFPDGPPAPAGHNHAMTGDTVAAYEYLRQHGAFQNGFMPEIPPTPDMIRWDV